MSVFTDCKRYHDFIDKRGEDMHAELMSLSIGVLLGQGYSGAAAACILAWQRMWPDRPLPDVCQDILANRQPQFRYFPQFNEEPDGKPD